MTRRIGLFSFSIECNRFGERATEAEFAAEFLFRGEDLVTAMRADPPQVAGEIAGFCQRMDELESWTAVPLVYAASHPKGPVDDGFFTELCADILRRLAEAGPLDGLYGIMHGAALTESDDDPDGALLAAVRAAIGPDVPLVATFDLHANVSPRMVANVDAFIGYRTNPHVDLFTRGAEAAERLAACWRGERLANALVRIPIVPPTLTMLTAPGSGPYADLMAAALDRLDGAVKTMSAMGSFPHSDTADNGIAIIVGADRDAALARSIALDLAEKAWADRHRYQIRLTSVAAAAKAAHAAGADPNLPALMLADLGDNPGGGAPGTSTGLLHALLEARATGFVFGLLHDPALVDRARAAGIGARVKIDTAPFGAGRPCSYDATVAALSDGDTIGRRGMLADSPIHLGPSALLAVDGGHVAITSNRFAPNDPMCFEIFGIDLAAARSIIVKSRGHFRAGFDEFATGERVLEVDTPGITSPNLAQFTWTRLTRPSYPLDPDTVFQPMVQMSGRSAA